MALTKISQAGAKDEAINEAKIQISNAGTNGQYLQKQSGNTGGLTWADVPAGVGGGTGLDVNDNVKIRLGTGNDLQVYHDSSNSYLANTTGNLIIKDTTGTIYLQSTRIDFESEDGEQIAHFISDGAVELYYDNSKKFETTSDGVTVTGKLTSTNHIYLADDVKVKFGASDDLEIHHDATNSWIDNSTGNLLIRDNTGNIYLQAPLVSLQGGTSESNKQTAKFTAGGSVELYYDNVKKFETSTTGGILSGTLWTALDNTKIAFGTNDDLQIYHDGSNSYLVDGGTGNLFIRAAAALQVQGANGENMIYANQDGSVELYHNAVKKFETTSTGITVQGNVFPQDGNLYLADSSAGGNGRATFGGGEDLQIWHNGSHSYLANNTGSFFIQAKDGEHSIKCAPDAQTELYYDNSKKLETTSNGITVTGTVSKITSAGSVNMVAGSTDASGAYLVLDGDSNGDGSGGDYCYLAHESDGDLILVATNPADDADFELYVGDATEKALVAKANGAVELYYNNSKKFETTNLGVKFNGYLEADDNHHLRLGNGGDMQMFHDGSTTYFYNHSSTNVIHQFNVDSSWTLETTGADKRIVCPGNGTATSVQLYYNGSKKFETGPSYNLSTGDLSPSANNSYNLGGGSARWATVYSVNALDTSDRNEKNTIQPSDLGLGFINKLSPVSYKWNDTKLGNKTHYGLIAQDLEEVIISEGKTLDDFGGIEKPESDPMSLGYKELISPLIKAIQELSAEVETLKTEVAALKAK